MTEAQICHSLKLKIAEMLTPLVGRRCVLLGVPYYFNIGDVLIWEGTREFIKEAGVKCLATSSKETFSLPDLQEDVTILLQGGGNFGDLWPEEHLFREKVIRRYPHNRIIVLPQSVCYEDGKHIESDRELYGGHSDMYVCARDRDSYRLLAGFVEADRLKMVPDMAFYLSLKKRDARSDKVLLLTRKDKESREYGFEAVMASETNYDSKDWPSMEPASGMLVLRSFRWLFGHSKRIPGFTDWVAVNLFRPYILRMGIRFISKYKKVYSTRLHGGILSILLSKPVTLFDNSYGKTSSFHDTWLSAAEGVEMIR